MNLFFCLQGKKYVILPSVIFMLFIGTDKMFCFRNKKVWYIAFAIFLLLAGVGVVCISIVCQKPNTSPNTLYIYIILYSRLRPTLNLKPETLNFKP